MVRGSRTNADSPLASHAVTATFFYLQVNGSFVSGSLQYFLGPTLSTDVDVLLGYILPYPVSLGYRQSVDGNVNIEQWQHNTVVSV